MTLSNLVKLAGFSVVLGALTAGCAIESPDERPGLLDQDVGVLEQSLGFGAEAACSAICQCEDPGSLEACKAECRGRDGFGSIPTCVACVNATHSCVGVKACLGSSACNGR